MAWVGLFAVTVGDGLLLVDCFTAYFVMPRLGCAKLLTLQTITTFVVIQLSISLCRGNKLQKINTTTEGKVHKTERKKTQNCVFINRSRTPT